LAYQVANEVHHLRQKELQMSHWEQLEKDISEWLRTFRSATIQFCNANQAIAGFPSYGFRSDGMLTNGRILVAVEVEASQTHPDTNVGKYWLLHAKYKQYQKIILFHVYTPDCRSKSRKELGEFYAEQMKGKVPLHYIPLDCTKAKDYDATLTEIKAKIGARVKQAFEATNLTESCQRKS
jgi:hypothetical protein